ncbi:YopX family protein, partial [Bacillus cereus]|nr:YopX family protein [Bacillus cereus]
MIKFRAYDKHKKLMCDVLNINFDSDIVHIKNPKTNEYWGRELKELNMIQFIGQNDSKGAEIYEGDIIETLENRWVVEPIGSTERDGQ